MSQLVITAYNVGFGDALLVAIPDRSRGMEIVRHLLIDVGNVLGGPARTDSIFQRIARDILDRLDGRPIDLYVMTHEHLDHVRGVPAANRAGVGIPVEHAWLTASAAEDYQEKFPDARRRMDLYRAEYQRARLALASHGVAAATASQGLLAVNNPASTRACVEFLRTHARRKPCFVYRGFRPEPGRHHPFREARLAIWAPERNTSDYYPRLRQVAATPSAKLKPPPGVEAAAFKAMIAYLQSGIGDNLLQIDRAANNTSVVLSIEWRGLRLLFPADAERKSWLMMRRHNQLKPVHFYKVGHHGSINGTPPDDVLDEILPRFAPDRKPRFALLSTVPDTYGNVPDDSTIRRIRNRVTRLYDTRSVALGRSVDIVFSD
jgi:beta-lactamase superfamily II metal-dependent hydrolase